MNDTRARLRRYVEDNFVMGTRPAPLGDHDSFIEHHVIDSTGFLELVAHLEETWGITVADDEMVPENLDSLAALDAYLARKQAASA